jgi:hypothetical protein
VCVYMCTCTHIRMIDVLSSTYYHKVAVLIVPKLLESEQLRVCACCMLFHNQLFHFREFMHYPCHLGK